MSKHVSDCSNALENYLDKMSDEERKLDINRFKI